MEEYQISQGKRLRCGYTTGSCATAAAKAAAVMLLTGKRVDFVQIDTPKGIILNLEPEEAVITEMSVTCAIRKDSGDDPDDTNGILIYATVEKTAEKGINLLGGIGIGYVTKPGLACIVEPMSEKALIETMYVEIDAQAASGNKNLLVFFGNYGADFTRDTLGFNIDDAVTCSNFVGELLDYAVYKGFETLLLIGHSGKLVKLGQGVMNTHSKYADCRTELMALLALLAGAKVEVGKEIIGCPTTDEVVKILQRENIFEEVISGVTERIDFYMQHRVHGKIKTAALMFSNVYGILGKTAAADELIKLHLKDKQEG